MPVKVGRGGKMAELTRKEKKFFKRVYNVLFIPESEMTQEMKENTLHVSVTNGYGVVYSYMVRKRHIMRFNNLNCSYRIDGQNVYVDKDSAAYYGLYEFKEWTEIHEKNMGFPLYEEGDSEVSWCKKHHERGFELVES